MELLQRLNEAFPNHKIEFVNKAVTTEQEDKISVKEIYVDKVKMSTGFSTFSNLSLNEELEKKAKEALYKELYNIVYKFLEKG